MKRLFQTWPQLVVLSAFVLALALPAAAQPTTSPSAVAAARLKNKPPKNWIRHYLGDDRYKIAGGIWKVVSTELDRYYYPAWAPEMLRQKPGIVIGFASAAEAEEAGYMPSGYPMNQSLYGLTAAEILAAKQRGTNSIVQRGTLIVLADGRSTVILPKGWKHMRLDSPGQIIGLNNKNYKLDILTPSDKETGISFAFVDLPGGLKAEMLLSPQALEETRMELQQKAGVTEGLKDGKLESTILGGLRGIAFTPGQSSKWPAGMRGRMTVVGQNSKMYVMSVRLPSNDQNYGVVVNSFQPR